MKDLKGRLLDRYTMASAGILTPAQLRAAESGRCPTCSAPNLVEIHRGGGCRWMQCARCKNVVALDIPPLVEWSVKLG